MNDNKETDIETGTEGELPTLIRYGDRITGFSSNTFYAGICLLGTSETSHSLILGFNKTVLSFYPKSRDLTGAYARIMGWWPVNPVLWIMEPENRNIIMHTPLVGYSYAVTFANLIEISATASTGLTYAIVGTASPDDYEESTGDNEIKIQTYNKIKNIDEKFGCRLNTKFKFSGIIDSEMRMGFSIGYTQYLFIGNNLNTYDIGTFISIVF